MRLHSRDDSSNGWLCARKRLMKIYGLVRTYRLDCVEQNVAWASSLVNYFEQKASAGTVLAFTSDLSVRAVISTNVYITGVNFTAENIGTQNIRNFTLALQEA
ncbi:MAG: hypothetical protein ABSF24_01210 [Candidatus Bathyarchaeia archaeon]